MAQPIADDWKAINDRMRQIQAERSALSGPCPTCNGLRWIRVLSDGKRFGEARVVPCRYVPKPKGSAPQKSVPQKMTHRVREVPIPGALPDHRRRAPP